MTNQNPPENWRTLTGAGATTPPPHEQSRSQGDMERNSFRTDGVSRATSRAVVNHDGTRITAESERLLGELKKQGLDTQDLTRLLATEATLAELLRVEGLPIELAGGIGKVLTITITRPANTTAYTANDVVNDVAGTMLRVEGIARKDGGSFILHGITLITDQGGGAQVWQPRVWLWQIPRETILADNAVFTGSLVILNRTRYLSNILFPVLAAPAGSTIDESKIEDLARVFSCAEDRKGIYFDLQTLTAFTPGSGAQYSLRFYVTQL